MRTGIAISIFAGAAVAASVAGPAPAAAPHELAGRRSSLAGALTHEPLFHAARTRAISINGHRLTYRERMTETVIANPQNTPTARFVSTDYLVPVRSGAVQRPVLFMFNGGPSVAALLLQFGGFGPRRIVLQGEGGSPGRIVDNPDSLIDAADLVFVDPVGTGFSHALAPSKDADFWGVDEDTSAIAAFVQAWLTNHDRIKSPIFIGGESYGGLRAIEVTHRLLAKDAAIPIRGEIILSGAIDFVAGAAQEGEDKPYPLYFPAMAAVAWYHHKVDPRGRDFSTFLGQAQEFAMGDYSHALFEGNRLSTAEKAHVAERMSQFVGLSAADIASDDLRIDGFTKRLMAVEGKVLASSDGRLVKAVDDLDPLETAAKAIGQASEAFRSNELKVCTTEHYTERAHITSWDWHFTYADPGILDAYLSGTGILSRDLSANDHLRAFLAGGYYDLGVSYFGTESIVAHLPRDRAVARSYGAGHALYLDAASRRQIAADLRRFIQRSP